MQTIKIFFFLYSFLFCFTSCDGQKSKNSTCSVDNAIKTINSLPEVQKQSKFVDSLSKNRQHLSFMTDTIKYNNKQYYRIKTGFSGQFHWETYTIFYVDKNNCKSVMVDETISGDIITLEKWRNLNKKNKMIILNNSADNVEFSDLFNEGSNIKFTPKDLNLDTPEIKEFKFKLSNFESNNFKTEEFNIDNLSLLINDETFSNNERYIDSSWLNYFINKYPIKQNIIKQLMDQAMEKEDFSAVKILSKYYIFSLQQIKQSEAKREYKNSLHGKLDTENYYDPAYSKIDDILAFITEEYKENHIQDSDGYTNLRKDKTPTSEILQKVKSGEHIEVLDNTGDWFLVKTKEGKEGYIHKSRIKFPKS
ncbi:SH3 domain-containing protein [Chryseobacterium bernardetii]|uniref:SH3 domain-containing protein n=1 Tax=Chryseobacterium bernardetii TaxID=1241978 RepID=A0A3G6T8C9_9FLAO|nr:SH3 domain-containing protein [Chryseobacterium bernardetii]AZB25458.1 SH3 domain-containing protein [Chryseobacterium bernardetii]